jgi:hypothetical protein
MNSVARFFALLRLHSLDGGFRISKDAKVVDDMQQE